MFNEYMLMHILLHLSYEECIAKMLVCRAFYHTLSDPYFWKEKCKRDFKDACCNFKCLQWSHVYAICEQSELHSVKNVEQWNWANKWGVVESEAVDHLKKAISEKQYLRLRLYFKHGANKKIIDHARLHMLEWTISIGQTHIYWLLVDLFRPFNRKMWQHAANYILNLILLSNTSSHFTMKDVFKLIDKSGERPHLFLHLTLGLAKTLDIPRQFHDKYSKNRELFFRGIGKHNNRALLEKYEADNAPLQPTFIKQALIGTVETSNVDFVRYLSTTYPAIVTSEEILYVCRIVASTPLAAIVRHALEKDSFSTVETKEDSLRKLMEVVLITYSHSKLLDTEKEKIEALLNLALEWGYDDYKMLIRQTLHQTHTYYEKVRHHISNPQTLLEYGVSIPCSKIISDALKRGSIPTVNVVETFVKMYKKRLQHPPSHFCRCYYIEFYFNERTYFEDLFRLLDHFKDFSIVVLAKKIFPHFMQDSFLERYTTFRGDK